jgi:hypothetical protein
MSAVALSNVSGKVLHPSSYTSSDPSSRRNPACYGALIGDVKSAPR